MKVSEFGYELLFSALAIFSILSFLPAFSASSCTSDGDCSNGESCSIIYGQCYLSDFAYTEPRLVRVPLGEKKNFAVLLASPLPETRQIDLYLAGEGKYFAKFVGGTSTLQVTLAPNETRRIPLIFTGGALSFYSVCVAAQDSKLSDVNNTHPNSKACTTFIVEGERRGVFSISTPSLGILETGAIGLIGASLYSFISARKNKGACKK